MYRVLIVCSGNSCRSPMAEGILRRLVEDLSESTDGGTPPPEIDVSSAGTGAEAGRPASTEAREAARADGLDISRHRTRPLTRELLAQSDLILVMEPHHAAAAVALLPGAAPRIRTVASYAGDEEDVADPIGQGAEAYWRTYSRLKHLLERALPRIVQAARNKP